MNSSKQFPNSLSSLFNWKANQNASQQAVGLTFIGSARIAKTMGIISPKLLKLLLQRRRPKPSEVRELFESLGVTYIKLGQVIASSPALFPKDYVVEFQNCLDNAPQVSFRQIKRIVESELGQPLDKLFAHVEKLPLATASIAQVHCARLHTGEDVVIKVQKPGVENIIKTDLNFIFVITRLTEWFTPGISQESLTGFISELYSQMVDECDFVKEANNLEQFDQYLWQAGNADVVVPKAYKEFSSKRVLTMERLHGENIKNYDELPKQALLTAMNTWFDSLMKCDFFHADLHSGNLMLLRDGRVGFIDFGMISRIPAAKWQAVFQLVTGLSSMNVELIADAMLNVGMTHKAVDRQRLVDDINHLVKHIESLESADYSELDSSINRLLIELGQLAKKHGLRFPQGFMLLIKQFMYFDQYVAELDLSDQSIVAQNMSHLKEQFH